MSFEHQCKLNLLSQISIAVGSQGFNGISDAARKIMHDSLILDGFLCVHCQSVVVHDEKDMCGSCASEYAQYRMSEGEV